MRRRLSLYALCLAWLFANGALWNVVQVVAWGQMLSTNLTYLSTWKALEKTFDGSQPCELCEITHSAQDAAREQLPPEATSGGGEKVVLISEGTPSLILSRAKVAWPGIHQDSGSLRSERVPVRPPRV